MRTGAIRVAIVLRGLAAPPSRRLLHPRPFWRDKHKKADEGLNPRAGWWRQRARTGGHHQSSNRSPPHAGNGISDRRDRGENAVYLQAETTYGDSGGYKKPPFRPKNATRANRVRALQGSNLGTNHAVIEPVSALCRERDFRPQRRRRKCRVFAGGDHVRRLVRIQKAPIPARECAHQGSNLGPDD
jgi:hypothetical protein